LQRLAYFFDFDYGDDRHPQSYMEPMCEVVRRWWAARNATERAKLDAWFYSNDSVRISDTRDSFAPYERELNGLPARLLFHCDTAATIDNLCRRPELADSAAEIETTLKQLCDDRLMLEDEKHYLSLPVFRQRPAVNDQDLSNAYITAKATTADPLLRLV